MGHRRFQQICIFSVMFLAPASIAAAASCQGTVDVSGPGIGCTTGGEKSISLAECGFKSTPTVQVDGFTSGGADTISATVRSVNSKSFRLGFTVNGTNGPHICNPAGVKWEASE